MGVTRLKKATEATVTAVGKGPGTYPYMAPEMYKTSRRGAAVDVYSLGCTLLELFGRRRVWPNLDASEIMMRVCGSFDTPPCMPDMSHLTIIQQEICSTCCNLKPESRPPINDLLEMINRL